MSGFTEEEDAAFTSYTRRAWGRLPGEVRESLTPFQRLHVLEALEWAANEVAADMY